MDLYKFDYEIVENKTRWKANIIGNNSEEAAAFLRKILGTPISIFSIESSDTINGITDEIISKIIQTCGVKSNKVEESPEIIQDLKKLDLKPKKTRMKRREVK